MSQKAADWAFYRSPQETWDAMYQDCSAAEKSIEMEQYIFHNDEVGQKFMRLFIQKAEQGLSVRLLCDEVGSGSFRHSPLLDEFRKHGGIFYFYNSVKLIDLLKPRKIFPRTHLKTLVIDAAIAYVGGVCIAQRMKDWRDTHIRVVGPVARQIERVLNRNRREAATSQREPHPPNICETSSPGPFCYMQSDPAFFRHPIYNAVLKQIGHSRQFVYICAAYFIPTRRLRRFLRKAAERGVDVVILVPENSDVALADWASLSYAVGLLKGGVRIFHYQKTMLHAKTMVIDGAWGTVGSCNLDPLSFFHNREANMIVEDKAALAEMKQDFLRDLDDSRELTLRLLKQLPFWKRIAMHVARLFRPIL